MSDESPANDAPAPADERAAALEHAARQMISMLALPAPSWPTAAVETLRESWDTTAPVCMSVLAELAASLAEGSALGKRGRAFEFLVALAAERRDARLIAALQPLLTPEGWERAAASLGARARDILHAVGRVGAPAVETLSGLASEVPSTHETAAAVREAQALASEGGGPSVPVEAAMWYDTRRAPPWEFVSGDEALHEVAAPDRDAVLARRRAQKAARSKRRG